MILTHVDNTMPQLLAEDRPLIMGVLNVTPDSFSDGGRFGRGQEIDHSGAISQAMLLHTQGAAIVDVGGEASSFHRRGIEPVDADRQLHRILPVIEGIYGAGPQRRPALSVDTRLSRVARAALQAGADMVNDISAGEFDPDILGVAAEFGSPIVLMHMEPETADQPARAHADICSHVFGYLARRAAAAMDAGIPADRIILDPGIGFGKTDADNWKLLAGIDRLVAQRFPVLLGVSRKRFLAGLLPPNATPTGMPASGWSARDTVTALTTLLTAQRGVRIHRVHDVSLAACALAALAAVHNP